MVRGVLPRLFPSRTRAHRRAKNRHKTTARVIVYALWPTSSRTSGAAARVKRRGDLCAPQVPFAGALALACSATQLVANGRKHLCETPCKKLGLGYHVSTRRRDKNRSYCAVARFADMTAFPGRGRFGHMVMSTVACNGLGMMQVYELTANANYIHKLVSYCTLHHFKFLNKRVFVGIFKNTRCPRYLRILKTKTEFFCPKFQKINYFLAAKVKIN